MCISCEVCIEDIWMKLERGQDYRTPDHTKGTVFLISEINQRGLRVRPQNISISKESFINSVHHLRANHHYQVNSCEIKSNNDDNKAGPLCRASRESNNNVRCINYILPILRNHGVVGISGEQPNRVWLVSR